MEEYQDFESCLIKKDEEKVKLARKTIYKLRQVYENLAIEHIFDRGSIEGLAEEIQKIAKKEYEYMW